MSGIARQSMIDPGYLLTPLFRHSIISLVNCLGCLGILMLRPMISFRYSRFGG